MQHLVIPKPLQWQGDDSHLHARLNTVESGKNSSVRYHSYRKQVPPQTRHDDDRECHWVALKALVGDGTRNGVSRDNFHDVFSSGSSSLWLLQTRAKVIRCGSPWASALSRYCLDAPLAISVVREGLLMPF